MTQELGINDVVATNPTNDQERLRQQNAYLAALHETALSLMNRLSLEDVLEGIVKHACSLTGTDNGYVYLLDRQQDLLEVKVGFGVYARYVGAYREKGKALSGVIWETGQPVAVEDYHSWERRASKAERPYGWDQIRSALGAPLKSGEEIIGVIGLGFSQLRKFTPDDITTISRFAGLASIALDNAQLHTRLQEELRERKHREEQLRHLTLHDPLTGLYNRTFFQEEMQRWDARCEAVGIIVCDIDGLKLINDTIGHSAGDQVIVDVGNAIKDSIRSSDVVARMGGDEFAILLPGGCDAAATAVCDRIRTKVAKCTQAHAQFGMSISVGYATRHTNASISETFRQADNEMYRDKLYHKQSSRGAFTQTLLKALEVRDFLADGHADRLQALVTCLGRATGLCEHDLSDLRLFAQFHDLGKIGITDNVLFKPEALTEAERVELRRHCEIGYRIAQTAPDLTRLADWILKHHEWWNGQGYPLGLSGTDIPLQCRILAIADAYDAMTNDRCYRKAVSHDRALSELKRCAGIQFDPILVDQFIAIIAAGKAQNR